LETLIAVRDERLIAKRLIGVVGPTIVASYETISSRNRTLCRILIGTDPP
jgi:hypothetical protein